MAISLILLILLIAFGYLALKASNWKASLGLYVMLALDLLVIFIVNIIRPFSFGGKDANNLVLFGIYLATAGALFTIPVSAFKEEVFKGEMPPALKRVFTLYLAYSVLLIVMVGVEAYAMR